jgi:4a-hydroxytetrahydrobiopterin dehydratase
MPNSSPETDLIIPDAKSLASKHCKVKVKILETPWLQTAIAQSLPDWQIQYEETSIEVSDSAPEADSSPLAVGEPIALERNFQFENYYGSIAFVNAIATMIHREDHHPQITLTYNRCVVRWDTHSVNGVSMNDLICAAKCDAIYAQRSF